MATVGIKGLTTDFIQIIEALLFLGKLRDTGSVMMRFITSLTYYNN